ncbi:hypothetical protein DFH27DRAFT_336155 [Peziza echinospora]|nr:hypothetical protein DFH27DRAFT_336155 [Peziza echinospora]
MRRYACAHHHFMDTYGRSRGAHSWRKHRLQCSLPELSKLWSASERILYPPGLDICLSCPKQPRRAQRKSKSNGRMGPRGISSAAHSLTIVSCLAFRSLFAPHFFFLVRLLHSHSSPPWPAPRGACSGNFISTTASLVSQIIESGDVHVGPGIIHHSSFSNPFAHTNLKL